MARRKDQAAGETLGAVPPEFAALFAGVPEQQIRPRVRLWLNARFGSEYADVYWAIQLAAAADRESVKFEAIRHLQLLLYGKAPERVIVEEKKEQVPVHGSPEELTPPERTAALLRVLHGVGQLSLAAAAMRAGSPTDAEVEPIPGEDPDPQDGQGGPPNLPK